MTSKAITTPGMITALALSAGLSGCADTGMLDLHDYVAEVKNREKGQIEPLPEPKVFETFVYDSTTLRDPFLAQVRAAEPESLTTENGIRPNVDRAREELESYSLDSLRMVGTLDQNEQIWAIISTGDGTIHRIQTGNHAGQNYGRIDQISEGKIELTEIIADGLGGWRERQAFLKLKDE